MLLLSERLSELEKFKTLSQPELFLTLHLTGGNTMKEANFPNPESVEIMSRIDLKANFLGLLVVTIATFGSLLTACSTNAQNQAQTPNSTASSSTTLLVILNRWIIAI
jgi:hypothetical protein